MWGKQTLQYIKCVCISFSCNINHCIIRNSLTTIFCLLFSGSAYILAHVAMKAFTYNKHLTLYNIYGIIKYTKKDKRCINMRTKVYYCDMDNVLANFSAEENNLERYRDEKGFFKNLKPIHENVRMINWLIKQGYKVRVISLSPERRVDREKREWLKFYVPALKRKHILLPRSGVNKASIIKDIKNAVLFDDYGHNCRLWRAEGGRAIKITKENNIAKSLDIIG